MAATVSCVKQQWTLLAANCHGVPLQTGLSGWPFA
jgi:hypothetical protein